MAAFINSLRTEVTNLITGHNPTYKVTKEGRVYKRNGQEFEYNIRSGYLSVVLTNGDEQYQVKVHRLVAYLYCPNYSKDNLNVVDHIDGNKLNNHYTNLEWVTSSENQRRAIQLGLRNFNATSGESHYLSTFTEAQLRECLNHPNFKPDMRLRDFKVIVAPLNCTLAQTKSLLYGNSWYSITKDYGIIKRDDLAVEDRPAAQKGNKLTKEQVLEIHKHLFAGKTDTEIGDLFNVSSTMIKNIRTGKMWSELKPSREFPEANGRQALNFSKLKEIQDKLNNGYTVTQVKTEFNISKSLVEKIKTNKLPKYLQVA
jgi:hypothetical protein